MKPANKGKGAAAAWVLQHVTHSDDACLIFPFGRDPNGYGQLGYLGRRKYAHRFMCELVHGAPPGPRFEAAHSCGNGAGGCANPKHLSWKTRSENRRESYMHGTGGRNFKGNTRVLTPGQLAELRSLKGKKSYAEIGRLFGLSTGSIWNIFAGKSYVGESKVRHWTPDEDQQLKDAIDQKFSFAAIGRLIGRAEAAVSSRAYRTGLKSGYELNRPRNPPQNF